MGYEKPVDHDGYEVDLARSVSSPGTADRELKLMQGHGFEAVLGEGILEIPPYSAAYVHLG